MPGSETRPDTPAYPSDTPRTDRTVIAARQAAAFADVILPRHLRRAFTYRIPLALREHLRIGSHVNVPFGAGLLEGVVVSVSAERGPGAPAGGLRDILSIVDQPSEPILPPDLLALSRQIADHYLAPWGQCLHLILPPASAPRPTRRYVATEAGLTAHTKRGERATATQSKPDQYAVLAKLAAAPKGLTEPALHRAGGRSTKSLLSRLKQKGWIQEIIAETRKGRQVRTPAQDVRHTAPHDVVWPSNAGPRPPWWDRMRAALTARRHDRFLLHASPIRQWDLLLDAARAALEDGRGAILVASGISRAEAIAATARARSARVEVLHSGLSPAERAAAWHRIRAGTAGPLMVVGTRSALFAPLPSVGLIALEDEDDPTWKEETEPLYHARDVAAMRARAGQAVLLLGSAHPSFESLYDFGLLDDTPPVLQTWPHMELIDLRSYPYGTLLSDPLMNRLAAAVDAKTGAILFLNRKGFAPSLQCLDCGTAPCCPQCSVALTFFKRQATLTCHYCGMSQPLPDTCPTCRAARLEPVGTGTERLEETVKRLCPTARLARVDREAVRTPQRMDAIRRLFIAGELDLLIGTQMLFQGVPLPPVGFVGLVHADAGLHRPDYRAGERTFNMLCDAVALARPREAGGHAVLQTYLPQHHLMTALATGNPQGFYEQEIGFRRALGYPPFTHLIGLRVSGTQETRVQDAARDWAQRLAKAAAPDVTLLGPIPAPIPLLRGRHRWQILVKSTSLDAARRTVRDTLDEMEKKRSGLKLEVDVDPVEMA